MNTFTEKELLRLSKSLNNKVKLIQEDTPGRTWGDTLSGIGHKIGDIGNDSEIEGITKRREYAETELAAAKDRLTSVTAEIEQLSPQKTDPKVYANLTKLDKEKKELTARIQYMTNRVDSYKKDEKEIMNKTPVGTSTPAAAPTGATQPATPATAEQPITVPADTGGGGKPTGVKQSVKYTDFQNDTARPGLRKTGSAEVYDKQVKYNKDNPDKQQITTDGIEGDETRTALGMSTTGTSGVNATKNNKSSKTTSQKSSPARTSMIKQMQSDLGVRQSGDFDQETTNALISRPDVAASYGMRSPTPKPNRPAPIAAKKPADSAPFDYAQRFNETTTFSTLPTINRMQELAGLK
jgi:hypothetical protein